jgi:uncharacterized protein YoxC
MSQQELEFRREVRDKLTRIEDLCYDLRHRITRLQRTVDVLCAGTIDPSEIKRLNDVLDQDVKGLTKATQDATGITQLEKDMAKKKASTTFNDLKTKVKDMHEAAVSAETALQTLGQFMRDHAADQTAIEEMGTLLTQDHADLAAAILANTPADPGTGPKTSGTGPQQVKSDG